MHALQLSTKCFCVTERAVLPLILTMLRNLHHRWVMPGRNYTTRFISEESGDVLASIVHIDTSPMIKKYRDKPENGRMLSELEAAPSPKSQREWVHETLKALDGISGYKFVVGHHPVKVGFQENENSAKVCSFFHLENLYPFDMTLACRV